MIAIGFALLAVAAICVVMSLGALLFGALVARQTRHFPRDVSRFAVGAAVVGVVALGAWVAIATFGPAFD